MENTLCKLLCKPEDQATTETNTVYETNCNNYQTGFFSESKLELKWDLISIWDQSGCYSGKNEIAKHGWIEHNSVDWIIKLKIRKVGWFAESSKKA